MNTAEAPSQPLKRAMSNAEEPPPFVAEEKIMRGVVSFLDFKGVEAFAQLCKFRAADGAPVPGYDPTGWWSRALSTYVDNLSRDFDRAWMSPRQYVQQLEAELAHDIYDPTLVSDADAWAARRIHYLLLYRASERAGIPTFIAPPPGCGEDEYDLRALAESVGKLDVGD